MNHEKLRFRPARERTRYIIEELKGLLDVRMRVVPEKGVGYHMIGVEMMFEEKTAEETVDVVKRLEAGDPAVWVWYRPYSGLPFVGRSFIINTFLLVDGDERVIVERLRSVLT